MDTKINRIVPYVETDNFETVTDFYTGVLGLELTMEHDDFLGMASPANRSAQILVAAPGTNPQQARMGFDVGTPAAVDAVHSECRRRGLEIVYPITDEPWGIHRFFVRDPSGTVINVLAHNEGEG
jgi:catechol 2,3-dioxygenase-like lactoylglutathione lyase family enzyme